MPIELNVNMNLCAVVGLLKDFGLNFRLGYYFVRPFGWHIIGRGKIYKFYFDKIETTEQRTID